MRSRPRGRSCALVCLAIVLVAASARGSDLEDFFAVNESDGTFGGRLYAGAVAGLIDDGDILQLDLRGHGLPPVVYDRDTDPLQRDFEAFVRDNADAIIEILFPSDLEGGAQGVPGAAARALEAFDRLVDIGAAPPAGRPNGANGTFDILARNQTSALFEYERYHVDGEDGNGYKLTPGYDFRFDHVELGFAIPLRYNELEDDIDTQAFTVGLDLHAKYHHYIFPEWQIIPMVGAGSNVFGIRAEDAPGAGYVRYGGYAGVSTSYEWAPFVVGVGVMYSISDIAVPGGLIPDELEPLADALTSRPADQQITVGGKAAYELPWRLLAAVGGRHLETIGSTDIAEGKQALSQVSTSLMYFPTDYLGFELGYKYLFGAKRLSSSSGYLQAAVNF